MAGATTLFSLFRARGWGRQSEQQVEVIYLAASASVTAVITPSAPYGAMVVHNITANRMLPGAFTVTVQQKEVSHHTVTLSEDLSEVPFWAWVTEQDPLHITVVNRLAFDGFVGLTLATLNFETVQDMRKIHSKMLEEL